MRPPISDPAAAAIAFLYFFLVEIFTHGEA